MKNIAKKRNEKEEGTLSLRLAEFMSERLNEFVVAAGMTALGALLEQDRDALCGPRYRHDEERTNTRSGKTRGTLVLGGRKVVVDRPRVRSMDGAEVALPSWAEFAKHDPLMKRTMEQMLVGVSTRRYARSLEPLPEGIEEVGTSKSAVSRRFIEKTEEEMNTWLSRRLEELDLITLMVDGVHVDDHVLLVALGIDIEGHKHVLGVRLGATENSEVARSLFADLIDRGMRTDSPVLFVIDGSKALRKAVRSMFGDRAHVQRCQVHKMRNVLEHLPESMQASVRAAMRQAYRGRDAKVAKRQLENIVRRIAKEHPDAARSLEEGLDETLTVMAFGLPAQLQRVLSTTNAIENLMGRARDTTRRVKRWRDGSMVLRWMVTAVHDASTRFRKVFAYPGLKLLAAKLRENDGSNAVAERSKAA